MSERSVSNIRAMFEAKETSPPSRGRSPAGSERSAGSRNVSSIRSSFVAVEKSGQLGPMLGLRRISDVASGSPAAMDRLRPSDSSTPGQLAGGNPLSRSSSLSKVQEEAGDLGTILKGSPFEDRRAGQEPAPEAHEISAASNNIASSVAASASAPKAKGNLSSRSTKPATVNKPIPITTDAPSKDKIGSGSVRTPTSATRTGPSVKVSSPRTSGVGIPAKPANKKPEAKLTSKPSRPSLSAAPAAPKASTAASQVTRAKSPNLATSSQARKTARTSNVAPAPKVSRPSVGSSDPDFLSRMSRPKQNAAKEENVEDKKPSRPHVTRPSDNSFLERMMRPTQASANKNQDDQQEHASNASAHKPPPPKADSKFLERMMKPTASSARKHEAEEEEEVEEKKPARTIVSGHAPSSNFLDRMTKPTASSAKRLESDEKEQEKKPSRTTNSSKTPDNSFLERMTKPTASSNKRLSNEAHVEPHSHSTPAKPRASPVPSPAKSKRKDETSKKLSSNADATEVSKGASAALAESVPARPELILSKKTDDDPKLDASLKEPVIATPIVSDDASNSAKTSAAEEVDITKGAMTQETSAPPPALTESLEAVEAVEKPVSIEVPPAGTTSQSATPKSPAATSAETTSSDHPDTVDSGSKDTSTVIKDLLETNDEREEKRTGTEIIPTPALTESLEVAPSADKPAAIDGSHKAPILEQEIELEPSKEGSISAPTESLKPADAVKDIAAARDQPGPEDFSPMPSEAEDDEIDPDTDVAKDAAQSASMITSEKDSKDASAGLGELSHTDSSPTESKQVTDTSTQAAPPSTTAAATKVNLGELIDLEESSKHELVALEDTIAGEPKQNEGQGTERNEDQPTASEATVS